MNPVKRYIIRIDSSVNMKTMQMKHDSIVHSDKSKAKNFRIYINES